jgi:hypothetical protein
LKHPFSLQEWQQQWEHCQQDLFQNKKIVWKTSPEILFKSLQYDFSTKTIGGEVI